MGRCPLGTTPVKVTRHGSGNSTAHALECIASTATNAHCVSPWGALSDLRQGRVKHVATILLSGNTAAGVPRPRATPLEPGI